MAKGDYLEMVPHSHGEIAHLVPPPDGTYHGAWTGYDVMFEAGGIMRNAKMSETGVRGTRKCIVTVVGGLIRVR